MPSMMMEDTFIVTVVIIKIQSVHSNGLSSSQLQQPFGPSLHGLSWFSPIQ